ARPSCGAATLRRRPRGERSSSLVKRPQLRSIADGLLEVVAQDLLELRLAAALAVDGLRPLHEALVGGRPGPFQQALVRRVADEDVVEAERGVVAIRGKGMDELL